MGTSFFKGSQGPKITGNPQNMEARSVGSSVYASRGAAAGASKSLGVAQALNKAGALKPMKNSAAYAKGPKI